MSFVALRDAAPLPPGQAARRFFVERTRELAQAAARLNAPGDERVAAASRTLADLAKRAERDFANVPAAEPLPATAAVPATRPAATPPAPVTRDGVDEIEGKSLTLVYEGKKCIHSRFCVTWGPKVFLANVQGPWIQPNAMDVEGLVEIAHACPSGAIRYRRKDGGKEETVPEVNLLAVREGGPYAVRADIRLNGITGSYRMTLCRCGASKNKPFCDGSHHEVKFSATGEPPTGVADALPVRDGPLTVDPQLDGPLKIGGNLEITSGTGRVVARVTQTYLCRCGASGNKPFCDGSHARIGFRSG